MTGDSATSGITTGEMERSGMRITGIGTLGIEIGASGTWVTGPGKSWANTGENRTKVSIHAIAIAGIAFFIDRGLSFGIDIIIP